MVSVVVHASGCAPPLLYFLLYGIGAQLLTVGRLVRIPPATLPLTLPSWFESLIVLQPATVLVTPDCIASYAVVSTVTAKVTHFRSG